MKNKLTIFIFICAALLLSGSMATACVHIDPAFMHDADYPNECHTNTSLYLAVIRQDARAVKNILAHGADANCRGTNGAYLLDLALFHENAEIIAALKAHGAKSTPQATMMHYAAWQNDCHSAAILLLALGHSVNVCRECSITPLHDAAFRGNYEITQFLLNNGANAQAINYWGKTALHDALYQHEWRVAALLVNQTDLDITDSSGNNCRQLIIQETANIAISLNDNAKITAINTLLKAAINSKTNSSNKISTLHTACYCLNTAAVTMALRAGADVNMQNFLGKTPLHDAIDCSEFKKSASLSKEALQNQFRIVTQLLRAGANPDKPDNSGATPFGMTICHNLPELTTKLLEWNANPNQRFEGFATVLHYCAATNRDDIAKTVLKHGANKDAIDHKGDTPLHLAYLNECHNVVQLLLANRARSDIQNKFAETAFDIAQKHSIRNQPKVPAFTYGHQYVHNRLSAE